MVDLDRLRGVLKTGWHRIPQWIVPAAGTLGRFEWSVHTRDERYLASLATGDRARVEAGLLATERLRTSGVAAGGPVRTVAGALTLAVPEGTLALSLDVPGRPLNPADRLDQRWWGDLLGRTHHDLSDFQHPGLRGWHWLRPDAPHLDMEEWIRPAVSAAVAAMTRLTVTDQLTYGVLHGDPVARAFRIDVATGRIGLTTWGTAATGPLVYDVAAAVLDAGGPAAAANLIDGYASTGPVPRDEIDAALPVLLRFRWAVRADRCARWLAAERGPAPGRPVLADRLTRARTALAAARAALVAG